MSARTLDRQLHRTAVEIYSAREQRWLTIGAALAFAVAVSAMATLIGMAMPPLVAPTPCIGSCADAVRADQRARVDPSTAQGQRIRTYARAGDEQADKAMILQGAGDNEAAEALLIEALDLRRRAFGGASPEVAGTLARLGMLLDEEERYPEAEKIMQRALDLWQALDQPDPAVHSLMLTQLARIRCHRVNWDGAPACDLSL